MLMNEEESLKKEERDLNHILHSQEENLFKSISSEFDSEFARLLYRALSRGFVSSIAQVPCLSPAQKAELGRLFLQSAVNDTIHQNMGKVVGPKQIARELRLDVVEVGAGESEKDSGGQSSEVKGGVDKREKISFRKNFGAIVASYFGKLCVGGNIRHIRGKGFIHDFFRY